MKKKSKKSFNNLIKVFSWLFISLMISTTCFAQNVGISPAGTVPPNASAGLDINFISQGLLIPRVALTATTNFAPLTAHVAGMVVYNTATIGDVVPGIYTNNGTKWVEAIPKASAAGEMQYWDGAVWKPIPVGLPGQLLKINVSGVPSWAP